MILPAIISWLLPMALGVAVGWWQGKEVGEKPGQFFRRLGIAALWTALGTFAIHALWLGALMESTGGIQSLPAWALSWTALTALFWFPVMCISLVIRARRRRREAGLSR